MMKRAIVIVFSILTASSALVSNAAAERELIDQVVAVVDDEAVFESDVVMMMNQLMFQQGRTTLTESERDKMHDEMLQNLINEKLMVAQAKRLDIDIPFSTVEERVNQAIADNKRMLGEEAFERQLEREGFTLESLKQLYREQIRNQMLAQEVLRSEAERGQIQITDDDLRGFYEEKKASFPQRPAVVQLKTIFVGFDSSDKVRSNALARIEDVHDRAVGGEPFDELAKTYSEDPSAPLGGDLGFVKPEDLADPVLAKTVAGLDVGEISEPVKSALGYHIIQVTEKNADTGEVHLRHILIRLSADDDEVAELYAEATRVHKQLLAGATFESMADQYSTDPNAGPGGDLGWLKVDDLPEFFQDVLAGMEPGDISQVLRESTGFRIVKLVAREAPRPFEFDEIRGELQKMYEQEKMEEIYARYVAQLRGKIHVATFGQ
jgi:peptidyl-prolyl cis-trans isomerase SurA